MNNIEIDEILKGNKEGKITLLDKEIEILEELKNGQIVLSKSYEVILNDYLNKLRNIDLFERKLDTEFDNYCNLLRTKTADEIIDSAYELVVKQEIKDYLKNMDLFPKEVRILLGQDDILNEFYHDWLNVDTPLGESLENSVSESISMVTRYYDKNKTNRGKESER